MIKNSNYLFILILLFVDVSAQTLPSDLISNDDETGYYEIKENNIDLTHFETANQQLILSFGEIERIIEKLSIEEKIAMCHAQSKFSSAGVPRLEFLNFGCRMGLMEFERDQLGRLGLCKLDK